MTFRPNDAARMLRCYTLLIIIPLLNNHSSVVPFDRCPPVFRLFHSFLLSIGISLWLIMIRLWFIHVASLFRIFVFILKSLLNDDGVSLLERSPPGGRLPYGALFHVRSVYSWDWCLFKKYLLRWSWLYRSCLGKVQKISWILTLKVDKIRDASISSPGVLVSINILRIPGPRAFPVLDFIRIARWQIDSKSPLSGIKLEWLLLVRLLLSILGSHDWRPVFQRHDIEPDHPCSHSQLLSHRLIVSYNYFLLQVFISDLFQIR